MKLDTILFPLVIALSMVSCSYLAKADAYIAKPFEQTVFPEVNKGCECGPVTNPGWPHSNSRVQLPFVHKREIKEIPEPSFWWALISGIIAYMLIMSIWRMTKMNER